MICVSSQGMFIATCPVYTKFTGFKENFHYFFYKISCSGFTKYSSFLQNNRNYKVSK